jgi:hypothetical protein
MFDKSGWINSLKENKNVALKLELMNCELGGMSMLMRKDDDFQYACMKL